MSRINDTLATVSSDIRAEVERRILENFNLPTSSAMTRLMPTGQIVLADIERMIAEFVPPTDPFNGACILEVARDVADRLVPLLDYRGAPSVSVNPRLAPGTGIGFRLSSDGDRAIWRDLGRTPVWFCGSPSRKVEG